MAEDVQFSPSWEDEATQCKNCKSFQNQGEKNACVPEGEITKSFKNGILEIKIKKAKKS